MRKLLSIALVVVFIFAFVVPAYATETVSEGTVSSEGELYNTKALTGQNWSETPKLTLLVGEARNRTATGCDKKQTHTYTCTDKGCTATYSYNRYDGSSTPHESVVYKATCDGTDQTWHYHCKACYYNTSQKNVTCPGGPHSASCHYLPC